MLKAEPSKKRAAESAAKTPVADKKAKATPQKTGNFLLHSHFIIYLYIKVVIFIFKSIEQQTSKSFCVLLLEEIFEVNPIFSLMDVEQYSIQLLTGIVNYVYSVLPLLPLFWTDDI